MNDLPEESEATLDGNVYIMTHSFFSDVVRIGCTPGDPQEYVKALSAKIPGEYTLVFSLRCDGACKIKGRIQQYLTAKKYVKEFYQVPVHVAERLLKREVLVIPSLNVI